MKYYSPTKSLTGYLLFELAVSLVVLMVLMQVLLPMLANVRDQSVQKTRLLARTELKQAVIDHFQSQLAPLFWRACQNANGLNIEIGRSDQVLPERINNKSLLAQSDWLNAPLLGRCSSPFEMTSLQPATSYACDWPDEVVCSSCETSDLGVVMLANDKGAEFAFNNDEIIGQSGFILSKQRFIWYLAKGKVDNAFWHTPELGGNSLELWSGIHNISIYPLLDLDDNGSFDTLGGDYGSYPISRLKGLWLEMRVRQSGCDVEHFQSNAEFVNHRGDVWQYQPRCEFILSFVVS